ncbi:MAG: DsbA family protein, partial [Rhodospirillales bacterium]|nr:DsbA family protein [Rhodospirillales bacterium]
MRLLRAALPVIFFALVSAAPAGAGESLSPAQKDEIRDLVREYLLENPEIIVE